MTVTDVAYARDYVHAAAERWQRRPDDATYAAVNAALDAYVVTLDASGEPWRKGSRG